MLRCVNLSQQLWLIYRSELAEIRVIKKPEIRDSLTKDFRKRGFYKWQGIAYFLFEFETHLKNKSKTYREKLHWDKFSKPFYDDLFEVVDVEDERDHHTIEHIYPQTPRKTCWTESYRAYNPKQKKALRHSLGNLVPLSKPKNSSFQNKCFHDKKGNLENPIGFSYGSYSEIEIAQNDDWTAVNIMERGLLLLGFMAERWKLNFGTLEEQLKLLNVEFVPTVEKISTSELKNKYQKTKPKSKSK